MSLTKQNTIAIIANESIDHLMALCFFNNIFPSKSINNTNQGNNAFFLLLSHWARFKKTALLAQIGFEIIPVFGPIAAASICVPFGCSRRCVSEHLLHLRRSVPKGGRGIPTASHPQ
jgi:hypothetical protein